jgi:hypothetical protein
MMPRSTTADLLPTTPTPKNEFRRTPRPLAACALAIAAFGAPLAAQGSSGTPPTPLAIAEGAWPGPLDIVVLDATAPAGAGRIERAGVTLIDLEITNRLPETALRLDRPRLVDEQGIAAIELPTGARLFGYRTPTDDARGYLRITPSGDAQVLLERPTPQLAPSPFADRLGVSTDGRHALVQSFDGLELWHLRLDGATFASTGTSVRTVALPTGLAAEPLSSTLGPLCAFFVTDDGRIWRLGYADGDLPQDVTPTGQPLGSETEDALAQSGDGHLVVFLYGPDDNERLWLVGETGPAAALPLPPSDYEGPEYLPEIPNGSRLRLDENGDRLAYVDGAIRDELFVLDTTGVLPTNHVTGDITFQPYIGTVIVPTFAGNTLVARSVPTGSSSARSARAAWARSTSPSSDPVRAASRSR